MGKRTRMAVIATSTALFLAAGSFTGYAVVQDHKAAKAREARVGQLVQRFKACPERYRTTKECYGPEERSKLREEARANHASKNYEEAGMGYAKLGMFNEAREMAGMCANSGNIKGRTKILTEVSERTDADRSMRQ